MTQNKTFGRRMIIPTAFAISALIALISLGTWQVYRLQWKQALIADVAARLGQEPVDIPIAADWPNYDAEAHRYQPLKASGRLRYDLKQNAYMVVSKPKGGPFKGQGNWWMIPLELEDGSFVWINRGFVPEPDGVGAHQKQFDKSMIEGLLRISEKPNFATPGDENGLAGDRWFVRNIEAMSEHAGLDLRKVAPFFIDEFSNNEGMLPQGGETVVSFQNRHFGYVLTWYGLALTLIGVFVAFARREFLLVKADSK